MQWFPFFECDEVEVEKMKLFDEIDEAVCSMRRLLKNELMNVKRNKMNELEI